MVYGEASSYKLIQNVSKIELFFLIFNGALSSISFDTFYVTGGM